IQFIGGAVGLVLLRRAWPAERFPFKMWLYPVPIIVAVVGWVAIFLSTGSYDFFGVRVNFALAGLTMTAIGAVVFLLRARVLREWPFNK
ncbi:MAG TPA: hypothetical protein VGA40_00685, partial [Candidatus Acidoferrales bacterium]